MTEGEDRRPSFSVVIPAKDEAGVIGRCLGFASALLPGEAEVVVVANGCLDGTAEEAARAPHVRVLELVQGGKSAALNAGDEAVTVFPRVYLDADVVVTADTLRRLAGLLTDDPAPAVAAPQPEFVTEGRPLAVRQFFAAFQRLPYVQSDLAGLGVYALNATGRARFGRFPDITADDLYVQRQFIPQEVRVLPGATFQIQVPRTLADLVKVRTRIAVGNAELAATDPAGSRTSHSTARALVQLGVRDPRLLPATLVYACVTVVGRARARRSTSAWERDASTR